VFTGLKERLLAPELVAQFVRDFAEAVRAANHARVARQSRITGERTKLERQMRNRLEMIKDGHSSAGMAQELRVLEQRHAALVAELAATENPEPIPTPTASAAPVSCGCRQQQNVSVAARPLVILLDCPG
jgi:site-specific DNA recombinase